MAEYKCQTCLQIFFDLGYHAKHQRDVHSHEKNFLFVCGACSLRFNTYVNLDVHLAKRHRTGDQDQDHQSEPGSLKCSADNCIESFTTVKDLFHHVLKNHCVNDQRVVCPLSDVCNCVNPILWMHSHFSKYHPGWLYNFKKPLSTPGPINEVTNSNINISHISSEEDGMFTRRSSTPAGPPEPDPPLFSFSDRERLKKKSVINNLAKFYLMMESEHCLPSSTVQAICEGFAGLLEQNLYLLKDRLMHELEDLGNLSEDVKNGITNRFIYADALYTAHDKSIAPGPWLCTPALRKRYYKDNFTYIEPIEKDLSYDDVNPTFVYYVPVEQSLNVMLKCPSVQCEIDKSFERRPNDNNVLEDYYDGLVYKNNYLNEKTLDIEVFQDGFKPTNDASCVANKHGTLGVYLALGNLPSHMRTQLDAIQLIFVIPNFKNIFKDKELRKRCWEILVEDLKRLERDGMLYKGEKIKVRLTFVIGDNLGQHEVGGFIGSFSADFFCRYCPITRTKFSREPWAREPLRTPQDYTLDMNICTNLVQEDQRIRHHRGVKSSDYACPFNSLEKFHASQPALPPCLAHDMLSGVVCQDLSAIIRKLVSFEWFDYGHLNSLIKEFSFHGKDVRNVPHEVPPNGLSLGGNAVQNWYLLRLLPFFLQKHNILDCSDQYWKLFLSLKEICEYLFAPSISLDQVAYLKLIVEDYMRDRTILGFDKPKDHFLNHFADLIVLFGPLKHLWTLPFESTHSYFRKVSRNSHNYINPGKTMTEKHCLYLAYMSAGQFYSRGISDPKGCKPLNILGVPNIDMQWSLQQQHFSTTAEELSSVTVNGITYKKDSYLGWILLGSIHEVHLHIGQIQIIVLDKGKVVLLLSTYTARRLKNFGVYAVSNNVHSFICVDPEKLKYPCLQPLYDFDGKKCFALEHTVAWESEFTNGAVNDLNDSFE